ncbi:MAG TPA: glucose 1-dehydrogenase [Bacilli bacterium]
MNIDLSGQLALVTGSNAGIGRGIALKLAACGAKVVINYLKNREQGEETASLIRQAGGQAVVLQADVADLRQIDALVLGAERAFGQKIDILVNNAGHLIKRMGNLELDEDHYNKVVDVNFKSVVFMCKAVAPGMVEKGRGKIVNVTSIAAHNGGGPGATLYAAAKAAVMTYTKGLAKELAGKGIYVNAVSPGFIGQTAFHDTFTPPAAREATVKGIPLGREGTPEDVANAVLFLVSPMSDYLTGETIEINGGMFMR